MCENLYLFEHFPPIIYTQICWRLLFCILAFRCEIISEINAITEVISLDRLIRMTVAGLEADQVTEVSLTVKGEDQAGPATSKQGARQRQDGDGVPSDGGANEGRQPTSFPTHHPNKLAEKRHGQSYTPTNSR